ncbi:MAG: DDE-type integrase/transposase/recombinase [Methylophaga sp.]|nr:DDE-type integrase/transposase/recombinase [Methylophaga sp.]
MQGYYLKAGVYLSYLDDLYIVTEEKGDDHFELKRLSDNLHITLTKELLLDGLIDSTVRFVDPRSIKKNNIDARARITADFVSYPEKDKAIARRKLAYVKAIIAADLTKVKAQTFNEVIDEVAQQINDDRKPHWNTVYRWHREYLASNKDPIQLTNNNAKKGNRTPRLRPEVQTIITQVINDHYLTTRRPSFRSVYSQVCVKIYNENKYRASDDQLATPTYLTVRNNIRKLPPEVVVEKHYGKHRAKVDFRAYKSGPVVNRILERVEADHTPLHFFVVDDDDRLPLGRPTLTTIIDYYSRCVTGFYISFNEPSTLAFLQALKYSIFPKTNVKKFYPDIENEWECLGLPELLVVDNGKEFHSEAFFDACNGIGIPYEHAPPLHPWYKGAVERHFGTLNSKLLDNLPGKTFHNIIAKDNYNPAENAVIDFSTLIRLVHMWVIDIYNQTVQKSLGTSPANKWKESVRAFPPKLPGDLERLNIQLGIADSRVINKDGITINHIKYNNEELGALRRKLPSKTKVKIKINPNDINYINVLDPISNSYFSVPSSDQRLTRGKTKYQYDTIRKYAARSLGETNRHALIRAEDRINKLVASEIKKTKAIKSRKKHARYNNIAQDVESMIGVKEPTFHAPHLTVDFPNTTYDEPSRQKTNAPEKSDEDFYAEDDEWQTRINTDKDKDEV